MDGSEKQYVLPEGEQEAIEAVPTTGPLENVSTPFYTATKTRISLGIDNTDATREGRARKEVRDFLEANLWTWRSFDPILPKTIFTPKTKLTVIGTEFRGNGDDERGSLARDANGAPRRLTPDQFNQVWNQGRFDVPSARLPEQYYTWELSWLLVFGFQNNKELLYDRLAVSFAQIIVSTRLRLFGRGPMSIAQGVRQIGSGFVDLLAALIGLPEMRPRYGAEMAAQVAQCLEKQHLLRRYQLEGTFLVTEDSTKHDLRPFFGTDGGLSRIASRAWSQVARTWMQERFEVEEDIRKRLKDQAISPALELQIANELVDEQARRFFAVLRRDIATEHRVDADAFCNATQSYLEAMRVLHQHTANREARVAAARAEVDVRLKLEHPILWRIPEWRERQLQKAEPQFQPQLPEALWQVQQAKLTDSAVYLAHHIAFNEVDGPAVRSRLEAEKVPVGSISIGRRLWLKRNWALYKQRDEYFVDKWELVTVNTSHPCWRWQIFAARIYVWTSNSLFFLAANLFAGPLSVRALCAAKPYQPDFTVDRKTGELIHTNFTVQTLRSRLSAIWRRVATSRAEFEATPDRGFLGKSFTRLFNLFWNYVLVGAIGTTSVVTIQPALTVANYAISIALAGTSIAWAPISVSLHRCMQLLFWDTDHQVRGSRWSPLLAALNRISTLGIIQIVGSVAAGVVIHPVLGVLLSALSGGASLSRAAYDFVLYYLAVRPRARVPEGDTFLCRMTHGPGTARDYFVPITTEEVLVGLRARLEREELQCFRGLIDEVVHQPAAERNNLIKRVFSPVGLARTNLGVYESQDRSLKEILKRIDDTILQREKQAPTIKGTGMLKQTAFELEDTLSRATVVVTNFYLEHIMPIINSGKKPRNIWNDLSLREDDWKKLTATLISETFGESMLEPLEVTEKSFKLDVKHTDVREFVCMIEQARPHDPISVVVPVVANTKKEPVRPTRVQVDPNWLTEGLWPAPRSFADSLSPAVSLRLVDDDKSGSVAARLQLLVAYSEEQRLHPPPGEYDSVRVPRDQVPWLKN